MKGKKHQVALKSCEADYSKVDTIIAAVNSFSDAIQNETMSEEESQPIEKERPQLVEVHQAVEADKLQMLSVDSLHVAPVVSNASQQDNETALIVPARKEDTTPGETLLGAVHQDVEADKLQMLSVDSLHVASSVSNASQQDNQTALIVPAKKEDTTPGGALLEAVHQDVEADNLQMLSVDSLHVAPVVSNASRQDKETALIVPAGKEDTTPGEALLEAVHQDVEDDKLQMLSVDSLRVAPVVSNASRQVNETALIVPAGKEDTTPGEALLEAVHQDVEVDKLQLLSVDSLRVAPVVSNASRQVNETALIVPARKEDTTPGEALLGAVHQDVEADKLQMLSVDSLRVAQVVSNGSRQYNQTALIVPARKEDTTPGEALLEAVHQDVEADNLQMLSVDSLHVAQVVSNASRQDNETALIVPAKKEDTTPGEALLEAVHQDVEADKLQMLSVDSLHVAPVVSNASRQDNQTALIVLARKEDTTPGGALLEAVHQDVEANKLQMLSDDSLRMAQLVASNASRQNNQTALIVPARKENATPGGALDVTPVWPITNNNGLLSLGLVQENECQPNMDLMATTNTIRLDGNLLPSETVQEGHILPEKSAGEQYTVESFIGMLVGGDTMLDVSSTETQKKSSDTLRSSTLSQQFPDEEARRNLKADCSPEVIHDADSEIFIASIKKSTTTKTGKEKKNNRVFDTVHACLFCERLVTNISKHLRNVHKAESRVAKIKALDPTTKDTAEEKQEKRTKSKLLLDDLRREGDHNHNLNVMREKRGQLILVRREAGAFIADNYTPCTACLGWFHATELRKHMKYRCSKRSGETSNPPRSKDLMYQSKSLMRDTTVSKGLGEVLSSMREDEFTKIVKSDLLIKQLGDAWFQKSRRNKLRRKNYASDRMRRAAKFLVKMQQLDPEVSCMSDCLKPERFEIVVTAVKAVGADKDGCDSSDDEPENPSVMIKLAEDIKRMTGHKLSLGYKSYDQKMVAEATAFSHVLDLEMSVKITKNASAVLQERRFNKKIELPQPTDVKKFSDYILAELDQLSLTVEWDTYRRAIKLVQCRLLTYNKRRPGELENIE